jgi:hypothetical protein
MTQAPTMPASGSIQSQPKARASNRPRIASTDTAASAIRGLSPRALVQLHDIVRRESTRKMRLGLDLHGGVPDIETGGQSFAQIVDEGVAMGDLKNNE